MQGRACATCVICVPCSCPYLRTHQQIERQLPLAADVDAMLHCMQLPPPRATTLLRSSYTQPAPTTSCASSPPADLSTCNPSTHAIYVHSNLLQVVDKDADAVLDEIEATMLEVAQSILAGNGYSFDIPSRAKGGC